MRVSRSQLFTLVLGVSFLISLFFFYRQIHRFWQKRSNETSEPRTLQLEEKSELRFLAFGDSGTGDAKQMRVAESMEAYCNAGAHLDGVFMLGDNFYQKGVTSTEDPQWRDKFETPYGGPCLRQVNFFSVLGNHDYKGNTAAQIQYHEVNPRWRMPARFYALEFGELLQVVAHDSNMHDVCFSSESCSLNFLLEKVYKSKARWNFVIAHHPIKSSAAGGESGRAGGWMGPILRVLMCRSLDAWIAGHDHFLEYRFHNFCKMDTVVSAGGGGPPRQESLPSGEKFVYSGQGFVEILVSRDSLTYRYFDDHGKKLFEASRKKTD